MIQKPKPNPNLKTRNQALLPNPQFPTNHSKPSIEFPESKRMSFPSPLPPDVVRRDEDPLAPVGYRKIHRSLETHFPRHVVLRQIRDSRKGTCQNVLVLCCRVCAII